MGTFTINLTAGAQVSEASASPTNVRIGEFADDLIAHYADPTITTQQQATDKFCADYLQGAIDFAKGLKQRRLDAAVTEADDLLGNT